MTSTSVSEGTAGRRRSLRISPELAWQAVGGEVFILDLVRGTAVGLNPTASLMWSLLPEHAEEVIAVEVSRRFEVDAATAAEDLQSFLTAMIARGYVVTT